MYDTLQKPIHTQGFIVLILGMYIEEYLSLNSPELNVIWAYRQ